jgi:hypothetical protein
MTRSSTVKTVTTSLALLGLLTVAACGGAASGSGAAAPASTPPTQGQGGQGMPGVTGLLAAVQGTTLQVQGPTSQTAVVYTATTAITQTVPATSADVTVGECVAVRSAQTTSGAPTSPVAATSVALTAPVNGSCAPGAGGGGGPGGPGGVRPSGRPNGTPPSGAPGAGRGFGGGAFGNVTAVNGSGFTVASAGRAAPGASPSASPTPVTVTTTAATTFTKQQKGTSAALKQGVCVTARGAQDSSGTVTATSIAVRPAVNGSCTNGFGARNG